MLRLAKTSTLVAAGILVACAAFPRQADAQAGAAIPHTALKQAAQELVMTRAPADLAPTKVGWRRYARRIARIHRYRRYKRRYRLRRRYDRSYYGYGYGYRYPSYSYMRIHRGYGHYGYRRGFGHHGFRGHW